MIDRSREERGKMDREREGEKKEREREKERGREEECLVVTLSFLTGYYTLKLSLFYTAPPTPTSFHYIFSFQFAEAFPKYILFLVLIKKYFHNSI